MSGGWNAAQMRQARIIWRHAVAYARWFDRADMAFRHWSILPERSAAVLLASRAGVPADLISVVSSIHPVEVARAQTVCGALARLPWMRAAVER